MEGTQNLASFRRTTELFKPEYLTWLGKGEKALYKVMDKIGIASDEQSQYIDDYQSWFQGAKADSLKYKRWATGVAAGSKEIEDIAKSFPDPERNSPVEYRANLRNVEETTKQVLFLNKKFLALGIDKNAADQMSLDQLINAAIKAGVEPPPGYGGSPTEITGKTKSGTEYVIRKK